MGSALRLLVDSSTLLWMTVDPALLSARARKALGDIDNQVFVSAASAWEIATKHRLGRLAHADRLLDAWNAGFPGQDYRMLAITDRHALRAGAYELAHADPFDRVIAAQADVEDLTLVASDRAFDLFPVTRLW